MSSSTTSQDNNATGGAEKGKRSMGLSWLIIPIGLILVIVIVGVARHQKNHSSKTPTSASNIPAATVSINKKGFFPKVINIKAGQAVIWTDKDTKPHWVASDPYPKDNTLAGLNSGAMQPKANYSYTFKKPGNYTYHDDLNPYKFQGTVMVK